jgi:hypothetical protein
VVDSERAHQLIFNPINNFRVNGIISLRGAGGPVWQRCGNGSGILLALLLRVDRVGLLLFVLLEEGQRAFEPQRRRSQVARGRRDVWLPEKISNVVKRRARLQ